MQKAIRIGIIVAICGLFIGLACYNSLNPAAPDMTAWNENMTIGDKETAKHHFVMYTDISCPFCSKFSNALTANWDDFKKNYIEGKHIYFEIRMTDMNHVSGHSNNSRPAAEGAYCAAKQEKFWEFYHEILAKLFEDYHSKGIGVSPTAEKIPDLDVSYFYDAADKAGLDHDKFVTCMEKDETTAEIDTNTTRAGSVASGLPYFVFDKFTYNGFAGDWNTDVDYLTAKDMLDAGLTTK